MPDSNQPEPTVNVPIHMIKRLNDLVTIIQDYGHFYPGQDGFAAMTEMRSIADRLNGTRSMFGYCPHCGASGTTRERRIDGNDTCKNGHVYPSRAAK